MPSLFVELHIRPDRMLDYYRGRARVVHAQAHTGQSVQFPAKALQRHITRDGIHGWYRLDFDAHHKFISLEPADPTPSLEP